MGVLADVLHLFDVAAALSGCPGDRVVGGGDGADRPDRAVRTTGRRRVPAHPEVYGSGLSLVRDVVLLPHARARLLLDDAPADGGLRPAVRAGPVRPAGRRHPDSTSAPTRLAAAPGSWPETDVTALEAA